MTATTDPKVYDENSVFNRLFAEETREARPSKGERLASIFANVEAQAEPIRVQDFLPSY